MLKKTLSTPVRWAIALSLIPFLAVSSAEAALFDQEEVESDKFVAIAVPLPQGGRYNLIILEQKSDVRPCWEEDPETGKVDPLLLTFDFSGICGRSTDSNGYSIRQVGEDLALKYRLSVQKKNGVLTLMGLPLKTSYGKPIEIGRTQSQGDDFQKIVLNPDWKFTRRVYQGKALGHIYLTRDVMPSETEPEELKPTSEDLETPNIINNAEALEASNVAQEIETNPENATTGEPASNRSSIVEAFDGPIQIPVPTPSSKLSSFNKTIPVSDIAPAPMGPIPVPTIAPLGQVGTAEPDIFSPVDLDQLPSNNSFGADSPPPPSFKVALSIRRYRVFVNPSDAKQSDVIEALAPDAFWTTHQGLRVLQMGSFVEKSKADMMHQALAQKGINATIDAAQY